ncbi:hypothetical protein JVU11DRAFT_9408 [Chiua virens]|nr:hypothetical protein JVU11DRAFT_9408 [Chiua virens]
MRPLIQYDLDEPPTVPQVSASPLPQPAANPSPPSKKRKRNHHHTQKYKPAARKFPPQHWDDPGNAADGMIYDDSEKRSDGAVTTSYADNVVKEEEAEYEEEAMEGHDQHEEEESRELTHEDVWDDSALIDAWNSAEAEYEAYHGTSKSWKTEPVKKSPLWYNKPYTAPPQATTSTADVEPDTAPLDFHTFVPTHDPSLAVPIDTAAKSIPNTASAPFCVPPPSTTMVSRDEAFNNALTAMYWSGYWTAVYHSQSQTNGKNDDVPAETTEEPEDEADEDEAEEDLVPAQR